MKYKTIIDTDDYKDFEFYEDGNGKYIYGIDAGSVDGECICLYFTECEQEPVLDKMTREEAIKVLTLLLEVRRKYGDMQTMQNEIEAIEMAIKALEQKTILDKIREEIENHCGLNKYHCHCKFCYDCNNVMGVREILEVIDKYKAESEEI